MLPTTVILFFAVGTGARHGEATINRDFSFMADTNARFGKRKVPVTVNSYVVVLIGFIDHDVFLLCYGLFVISWAC